MTHTIVEAIYAIRHKQTGQYIKFGSKCAWATSGAAKNAWNLHTSYRSIEGLRVLFSEQDEYEFVDILGSYESLSESMDQACELNTQLVVKTCDLELQVEDLEERLAVFFP